MKLVLILPAMAVLCYFSCNKEDSDPGKGNTARVVSDKSEVRPGDVVAFSVKDGTAGAIAKWTVTPNTNVVISRAVSWDQKNTITFNATGNYTVRVELKKVWCDSAAAANPGMDTCLNSGVSAGQAQATIMVKP